MGASTIIRTHAYVDHAALKKWVREKSDQDAFEHGSSYSGYWNMCHGDVHIDASTVYESVEAASSYIEDNHEKNEPLLALPARQSFKLTAAEEAADTQLVAFATEIRSVEQQVWGQDRAILVRTQGAKSKFKSCVTCESRINVTYLRSVNCPACQKPMLRTASDIAQTDRWTARSAMLREKYAARYAKLVAAKFKGQTPLTVWVVGGACGS